MNMISTLACNALEVGCNLTHASDSVENGVSEKEELVDWKREVDQWVFEK